MSVDSVCVHTHGSLQTGPEGAWRWRVLFFLVSPCRAPAPLHSQRMPGACTRMQPPSHVSLVLLLTCLYLVAHHMTLHPSSRGLRSHSFLDRDTVVVHHRRPPRRFRSPHRPFSSRTEVRLHVRASRPCSLEWLLQLCLTQERIRQPQPSRPSAGASTGATSARAGDVRASQAS